MPFIVEDGTIIPGANALASVADVDGYFADRGGFAEWTAASNDEKQIAIVRATDYVERRFGRSFRGYPTDDSQALTWPRTSAYKNNGGAWGVNTIPEPLKRAVAEYAVRSIERDLLNPEEASTGSSVEDIIAGGGKVTKIRSKVDVIEEEFTFSQAAGGSSGGLVLSALASDSAFPAIPAGDLWIEQLLVARTASSIQFGHVYRG